MVLETGELVHIITRRQFVHDTKRHFAGVVESVDGTLARVRGYTFVFDTVRNEFVKRHGKRMRIMSLGDVGNVINVVPPEVELEDLRYELAGDGRLVMTDGASYQLDINEFGSHR